MKNILKICINSRCRAVKSLKTCAAAVSLIVLISTGTSWAFTTYDGYQDVPPLKVVNVALQSHSKNHPSSAVTDSCIPLLKSIHKIPSKSVTTRNQRSAGNVAAPVLAVGLIFGVRYALSPPGSPPAPKANSNENYKGVLSMQAYDRPALAVSAYRACQKKQALNALSALH